MKVLAKPSEHQLIYTVWKGGAEGYSFATPEEIRLLRLSDNLISLKEHGPASKAYMMARQVSCDK